MSEREKRSLWICLLFLWLGVVFANIQISGLVHDVRAALPPTTTYDPNSYP